MGQIGFTQESIYKIPDYDYRIDKTEVYPDSGIVETKYYDSKNQLISSYNKTGLLSGFVINHYQKGHLVKSYSYNKIDSVINQTKEYEYFDSSSISKQFYNGELGYYSKNFYTGPDFMFMEKQEIFEIFESDTQWTWTINYEYDSLNRIVKTSDFHANYYYTNGLIEIVPENDSGIVENEYSTPFDSLKSTKFNYKNGTLIDVYHTSFNSGKTIETEMYFLEETGARTKTVFHLGENKRIIREEVFGEIQYGCLPDLKGYHGQKEPITEEPDRVYVYRKNYR